MSGLASSLAGLSPSSSPADHSKEGASAGDRRPISCLQQAAPFTQMTKTLRLLLLTAAVAGAALGGAASALACGNRTGYSYAGIGAAGPASGISAIISPLNAFDIVNGHVAGWVGVGGPGVAALLGLSAYSSGIGGDIVDRAIGDFMDEADVLVFAGHDARDDLPPRNFRIDDSLAAAPSVIDHHDEILQGVLPLSRCGTRRHYF